MSKKKETESQQKPMTSSGKNSQSGNKKQKPGRRKPKPVQQKPGPADSGERRDNPEEGYPKQEGSNDLAWHAPDGDLEVLKRASELSWSYETGDLESFKVNAEIGPGIDVPGAAPLKQPGFMVIREVLTCGPIGEKSVGEFERTDLLPSYIAATTCVSIMRSLIRVRNTYDAPDVFMLNNGMLDIYAGITVGKRLAATVNMFTYQNKYYPRALIKAQGFDPDWFTGRHQYSFVTELNNIISEVNTIYIPNRMGIFKLMNERYANYYNEGDSLRDQLYFFTPGILHKLELLDVTDYASGLVPRLVMPGTVSEDGKPKYDASHLLTGDDLIEALRDMLYSIVSLTSTADITGDMKSAFGEENRFVIAPCDPNALALPVFNEEILETIHNMVISKAVTYNFQTYDGTAAWTNAFKCLQRQSDNRIGYNDLFLVPKRDTGEYANANVFLYESAMDFLDVHSNPGPEKTFAITRLKNLNKTVTKVTSGTTDFWAVQVGFASDLVLDAEVWSINLVNDDTYFIPVYSVIPQNGNLMIDRFNMECFHYRPTAMMYQLSNGAISLAWFMGESDIYAQVDARSLRNMNRISLMSLWGAYNTIK